MATAIQLKAEDLLRMPNDGFRYELVRGELRRMSPAGNEHGRIAANITGSLVPHPGKTISEQSMPPRRVF